MSRLDFCKYELVDDCYDWKNDNCDECNIFKAYCEGARRAKNSIVRCKDCKWYDNRDVCHNPRYGDGHANYSPPYVDEEYWCKDGERSEP